MRIFSGLDKQSPHLQEHKAYMQQRHKNWTLRNLNKTHQVFSADYKFRSMLRERMNPSLWGLEILLSVSLSHSLAVCADLWLHLLWLGNLSNCAIPGEAEEHICPYVHRYINTHILFKQIKHHCHNLLYNLIVQNGISPKAKPVKKPVGCYLIQLNFT